ncbi:hypothetical protein [Hydrogenimonas thermophila]|uniref:Uncharacterized protein n=1 Tax=Hydrogenimonas thermophila TaxID=223786 RepID=A0A1I5USL8_9BACT|nr:hypothetical protein [Hydrogenimonas thermophila]SFP98265.1 hypothetical protein SAMN05216234_1705 [Hydrogenimonas thermophila]
MAKKSRKKRSIYSPYLDEIKDLLNKGHTSTDIYKKLKLKYNLNAHYM